MLKTKLHNVLCDLRCNTSTVMADDSALFQGGPLPDNYTPHLVNHAACARVAPSRKLSYICFEMTCVGERKAPPPQVPKKPRCKSHIKYGFTGHIGSPVCVCFLTVP